MSKLRITEAFGIEVKTKRNLLGQTEVIPPPPNVLRVLGNIGWREENPQPGHGPKTQKRRSKRRRLRARDTVLRRHVLRSYHEELKRQERECCQGGSQNVECLNCPNGTVTE